VCGNVYIALWSRFSRTKFNLYIGYVCSLVELIVFEFNQRNIRFVHAEYINLVCANDETALFRNSSYRSNPNYMLYI
jgi:hypothetical protein